MCGKEVRRFVKEILLIKAKEIKIHLSGKNLRGEIALCDGVTHIRCTHTAHFICFAIHFVFISVFVLYIYLFFFFSVLVLLLFHTHVVGIQYGRHTHTRTQNIEWIFSFEPFGLNKVLFGVYDVYHVIRAFGVSLSTHTHTHGHGRKGKEKTSEKNKLVRSSINRINIEISCTSSTNNATNINVILRVPARHSAKRNEYKILYSIDEKFQTNFMVPLVAAGGR